MRVCLTSIIEQINKTDENILISVYNNASDDNTNDVLDEFVKLYPSKIKVKTGKNHVPWTESFKNAFLTSKTEYLWMFGDDDILVDGGLETVISILKRKNVDFIHASEFTRAGDERRTYYAKLTDLCSGFGFTEITGFISGNICRSKPIHEALKSKEYKIYRKCSFMQSMIIMDAFANSDCAFINAPIIDNQDRVQANESCERWQKENIQLNYAFVGLGLKTLMDKSRINSTLPIDFFRYLTGNMFGKSLYNFYAHSEVTKDFIPKKHIEALYLMAGFLEESEREEMNKVIYEFMSHHKKYIRSMKKMEKHQIDLQVSHDKSTKIVYPFTYV